MTPSAHASRRFHGATEDPTPPTSTERFSLRAYSPWLYAEIPSSKPVKPPSTQRPPRIQPARIGDPPAPPVAFVAVSPEVIVAWLRANGWATAPQIAAGLNRKRPESVTRFLRQGIDGVEVKGWDRKSARKPVAVWGIKDDGHTSTSSATAA